MRTVVLLLSLGAAFLSARVEAQEPAASSPPPPAFSPGRARILVLDIKANDVDPNTVATVTSIVVAGLAEYRTLDVLSGEDVRRLADLEASRMQAGCSDDASCLSEIAGALGAQLVVFGAVGRLGEATVVSLNLFDSQKAQALGRVTTQTTRPDRLTTRVRRRLYELVRPYHEEHNLVMPPPPPEEAGPSPMPWVVTGSGAALLAVGVAGVAVGLVPLIDYNGARARIDTAQSRYAEDPAGAIADGKAAQAAATTSRSAFNQWGYLALDAGGAVAALGALGTGVGLAWALAAAEPDDPDTPAAQGGAPSAGASATPAPAAGGAR